MDTLFVIPCSFIGQEQCEACGTSKGNDMHYGDEFHFVKDEDPLTDNVLDLDHLQYMTEKIPNYIQLLVNRGKKTITRIPTTKFENPSLPNSYFFCTYCSGSILEYLKNTEEFTCITQPKNKRIRGPAITKWIFEPVKAPVKSARKT